MADSDLIDLYSKRILAMASDIPLTGRLDAPMGTARVRAPLCGSVVTVDVDTADGRVIRFAQDVKACALGQAAASVLGHNVIGRDRAEIAQARDALAAMLASHGDSMPAPFGDLDVFRAARGFANRHASILLSLDATLAAIDAVAVQERAQA